MRIYNRRLRISARPLSSRARSAADCDGAQAMVDLATLKSGGLGGSNDVAHRSGVQASGLSGSSGGGATITTPSPILTSGAASRVKGTIHVARP